MRYTFGVFEFDAAAGELRKNGRLVALEPQPAKALALLLSRAGVIISRDEMREAVWGQDTHVDFDRGLAYCVSQIRAALGDSGENPRFVQTIPKRGFKFIAPLAPQAPHPPQGPTSAVLQSPTPYTPTRRATKAMLVSAVVLLAALTVFWTFVERPARRSDAGPVVIGVSVFDNETGLPEHDRLVAGLSDLVVERLSKFDPDRIAVVGNANILRQPRNIRNLEAVAQALDADYVLLGQLQKGEAGLRFITHFIRLRDQAHLKANRLVMPDGGVNGLEAQVVEEFERAVRQHVLNQPAN